MNKAYLVFYHIVTLLFVTCSLSYPAKVQAGGNCAGKFDIGPTFMHVDILESGKTVKRMDMPGVRGELSYCFWKGLFIKPVVLYGHGGAAAKGGLMNGGLFVGQCIPLSDRAFIAPSIGVSFSHLWTRVDLPQVSLKNLKQNFKSVSPTLSLDVQYNFGHGCRMIATVQYAWAHTHTSVAHLFNSKSHSQGFNYAFLLEKDLNDHWSVNLGAAYSLSLSKEKHGIRASGLKLGLAYWF